MPTLGTPEEREQRLKIGMRKKTAEVESEEPTADRLRLTGGDEQSVGRD